MRLPREPGVVCNNGFFHPPEAFAARQTDPKPAASENEPRPETTKDVYERAGKRRNDPPDVPPPMEADEALNTEIQRGLSW
jgi:hypothetical protein